MVSRVDTDAKESLSIKQHSVETEVVALDDVEVKLKKRLSEEDFTLLNLFLTTPPSRLRDVIVKLVEEAEKS